METKVKRMIQITNEDRAFLLKTFGVTREMIRYALVFDKKHGRSDLAKRIRTVALQRGGKLMNLIPECETIHDANGMMRQQFENGAQIELNKSTAWLRVTDRHGKHVREVSCPTIQQLYIEQVFAAGL
ncbi:hypothetical protein Prede_2606 [Prevotella dentalis DSM 3688]|nr:hypothetical protein [Prevotella dentalis]AGB29729.1 hypothetical protein Prede_2483 [Prevotella dentalis DSM 3688]AGB29839.1 hypothetical protein Prede_2606 [Prevotella dentalis DSM 3688]